MYTLIFKHQGVYGAADGYSLSANIFLGWIVSAIVVLFGIVFSIVESIKMKDKYDPKPLDELE